MITNPDNFFGLETGDAKYNARRHFNIVFSAITFYEYGMEPVRQISQKLDVLSYNEMSNWLLTDVFSPLDSLFLKKLSERLNLSHDEFIKITGCIGCRDRMIKSPAKYNASQNVRILIHLALVYSHTHLMNQPAMHEYICQWCDSFHVSEDGFQRFYTLTKEAERRYGIAQLTLIEEFVLSNTRIV